MIQALCEKHIELLEKTIKENSLIVYKGFPSTFLKALSIKLRFVTDISKLFKDDKIDLNYLINNKSEIVKSFLKIEEKRISTYEEFTVLYRNINPEILDYNIIIVNNSLFQEWYPNPSDTNFPDLIREIEKTDEFEPPAVFTEFYSNSQVIDNNNFISYYDLPASTDRIKLKGVFTSLRLSLYIVL